MRPRCSTVCPLSPCMQPAAGCIHVRPILQEVSPPKSNSNGSDPRIFSRLCRLEIVEKSILGIFQKSSSPKSCFLEEFNVNLHFRQLSFWKILRILSSTISRYRYFIQRRRRGVRAIDCWGLRAGSYVFWNEEMECKADGHLEGENGLLSVNFYRNKRVEVNSLATSHSSLATSHSSLATMQP